MAGGVRIGSDSSGSMEEVGGGDLANLAPQPSEPMRTVRMGAEPGFFQRLVTPSPWEGKLVDSLFGSPEGDVNAMAEPPASPVAPPMPRDPSAFPGKARQAYNDAELNAQQERVSNAARSIASEKPTGKAGPSGPSLKGQMGTYQRPGTNPKTAMPLYFAQAMGYAIPGASGDEEEARFAKAAHSALLKMTKGMTVARFLAGHQSPKTRDTFGRLLDAELAKGRQTPAPSSRQAPTSSGKTPPKNEPRQSARLPLQPI